MDTCAIWDIKSNIDIIRHKCIYSDGRGFSQCKFISSLYIGTLFNDGEFYLWYNNDSNNMKYKILCNGYDSFDYYISDSIEYIAFSSSNKNTILI